jgi:hypothetical protein
MPVLCFVFLSCSFFLPSLAAAGGHAEAERLLVLAEASDAVYGARGNIDRSSAEQAVRERASGTTLMDDYTVRECIPNSPEDGDVKSYWPGICIFESKSVVNKAILAIKGTSEDTDLEEGFIANVVLGFFPAQAFGVLSSALTKLEDAGYDVLVTGHSLGGYYAEILSTHRNVPGIAFAAAGPEGAAVNHNGQNPNPDFHIVNAFEDWRGNFLWPKQFHYKPPIWMEGLESHFTPMIMQWIREARWNSEVTNQNVDEYIKECPWWTCRANLVGKTSYLLSKDANRN